MSFKDELIAAMQATATAAKKPRAIATKEWGTVYVRQLTVAEIDAQDDTNDKDAIARGAARVISDKDGNRIFDPDNKNEVSLIAAQPWSLLRKVLQDKDLGN